MRTGWLPTGDPGRMHMKIVVKKTTDNRRDKKVHGVVKSHQPAVFCAKSASWMTASLGCTAVVVVTVVGAEDASNSSGTGEPSRDRLSGVWMPLE